VSATPLRFGPFEFHPQTGELRRDGHVVRLEPQPAKLLALLVSRPGALVPRDEIRRHVWGDDVHVDVDRGVAYALNQVRAALGDSAERAQYVETLPRRGVRFIGAVESTATIAPAPPARSRRWAIPLVLLVIVAGWMVVARPWSAQPQLVVAVSLFDNETGDSAHDAFVARMSDAIVARLAEDESRGLQVIGNEAILRRSRDQRDLVRIRRETRAEFVVIGQLQPDPGGLRIIAHLIRLDDGTHAWAERFVRDPGNLDGLEDQVAEAVAAALGERLVTRP
jgi:DNA-binding winged helix-turn-helix (wHTH) protein/TolB-like protein